MKLDKKNILIGAGVVILGYLLWKKMKRNAPISAKQMECDRRYSELLQPSVMMPEEYWKKRKDDWMKINCYTNSGVVTPKANEIQRHN